MAATWGEGGDRGADVGSTDWPLHEVKMAMTDLLS